MLKIKIRPNNYVLLSNLEVNGDGLVFFGTQKTSARGFNF